MKTPKKQVKPDLNYLAHLRHSCSHLLAAAVMDLWPNTKRAIGPAIQDGFYFDFEFENPVSAADFPKIEQKMRQIVSSWDGFEKHELDAKKAKAEYPNNSYKHELIDEFSQGGKEKISFYKSGDYWDLCKGGHVDNPKEDLKYFKLLSIAGAYWRGDEKNPMLTRIYGTAFPTQEELDDYLWKLEEAKRRDHKKLGPELDLFTFSDLVGSGLALWTPKGTILRNLLDDFVWKLRQERGYSKVEIPHITKKELYETSGHWDKFKDELFRINTREGHEFAMKPMNCPHHTQIFARKAHSYREMPQRYANTTMVYRDEQTGELSGLSRVRSITQDDAHVFCRKAQAKSEIMKIWDIIDEFYSAAGFTTYVRLSLSDPSYPEKYLGSRSDWDFAENQLREVASERGVKVIEAQGEAAFYAPKLDFMARDSLGREWQVATNQLDVNMPNRFGLYCINEKGDREEIFMIHAAIMGAIERYLSILIEHFAGAFPVWLSPVQVVVLPISQDQSVYAKLVTEKLQEQGIRIELWDQAESIGKRIRLAEKQKIPYMLIVGKKEVDDQKVSVRGRGELDLGTHTLEAFSHKALEIINSKSLDL